MDGVRAGVSGRCGGGRGDKAATWLLTRDSTN